MRWIGYPLKRKEDIRFITGRGLYIDDISLPGMVYAHIVRSPYAHARIKNVDVSKAEKFPGVIKVFSWDEIVAETHPLDENRWLGPPSSRIKDYIVANEKVRYHGEPVCVIVGSDKGVVEDAAELVEVEYEPLTPVTDPEEAMRENSPLIHEEMGTNVAWRRVFNFGDVEAVFNQADYIIKDRFHFHRFTSAPLENSGVIAQYDKTTQTLTIWSNNQRPGFCGTFVARALGISPEKIRFIVPDIGGGFGNKTNTYPYLALVAFLAYKTGLPVKWIESRTEHLLSGVAGNEVISYAELAIRRDGKILGFRQKLIADEGAYMRREPLGILNMNTRISTLVYDIRAYGSEVYCVLTNKAPISPNRSYGKMQQAFIVERLVNKAARKLNIDPADFRLRNLITKEQMPYTTPSGAIHDGGDYPGMLRRALEAINYHEWIAKKEEYRKRGRFIGIGIGFGMDANPANMSLFRLVYPDAGISGDTEAAVVEINELGGVLVATGSVPQGQGHETTIAQIVADELGITPEQVHVLPRFDTLTHPYTSYSGTYASRFSVMSLGALKQAITKLKEKILKLAGHLLEVSPNDLEIRDGAVYVKGTDRHISLAELAWKAWRDVNNIPPDMEPGLKVESVYRPPYPKPNPDGSGNYSLTYPVSINAAIIEVDPETGRIEVLKYVAIDDPGTVVNPLIVEGQIHGAWFHQFAGALYEKMVYDANGQLLTTTFADYLAPTAADIPDSTQLRFELNVTPSLFSAYGSRGIGEGGGAPLSTLANAIEDALKLDEPTITEAYLEPPYILKVYRENRSRK